MPLSPINYSSTIDTHESVNPGMSTQITIGCTPPPSDHNIDLPLDHPSILTNDHRALPSYEEVIDPNALPPSYDSLFGRIREAHKVSTGVFDFLKNILILLLGTVGCTVCLIVSLGVPVSAIVIGGLYINDCPQGEFIPIYLLVFGVFGIFKQILQICARVTQCLEERLLTILSVINCFLTIWFYLGSVWVYKEYEPNYDPALGKYCNKIVYLFTFWLITFAHIMIGLFIIIQFGQCVILVIISALNTV